MSLEFRDHFLPGRVRVPVAFLGASQGNNAACASIAVRAGAVLAGTPELDISNFGSIVEQAIASHTSNLDGLQDPKVAAESVPGVRHITTLAAAVAPPPASAAAAVSAGCWPTASPLHVVEAGIAALGGCSGFLTVTNARHSVLLLPKLDAAGVLVSVLLINFMGSFLYAIGELGPDDPEPPGFAIQIAALPRRNLRQQIFAVFESLYWRRYAQLPGWPSSDPGEAYEQLVLQIDVFKTGGCMAPVWDSGIHIIVALMLQSLAPGAL